MMNLDTLKGVLVKHLKWLRNEAGGEKADLRGADLRGANLREADLRGADLRGANLREANLYEADLYGANLREANLYGADLYEANLRGADLYEANLRGADLYGANLREANLYEANLRGADLYGANLYEANLREADLYGANLREANLREANLPPEFVTKFFPLACPESGAFIGWKKCNENLIVKLQIPEDARRSSAFGRKCRCDKAIVLAIESLDGGRAEVDWAVSQHDSDFHYHVGETVSVDNFDTDRTHECAPGIHFFITRQEAVDY